MTITAVGALLHGNNYLAEAYLLIGSMILFLPLFYAITKSIAVACPRPFIKQSSVKTVITLVLYRSVGCFND